MSKKGLAKKVYSLQNGIVRALNDAHIFLEQVQPLLENAKVQYEISASEEDRRYPVPSVSRRKYAERTDGEVEAIYNHYISIGLFEAFLVNSLSRFESFLAEVLFEFLSHYPQRITERVPGIPSCPPVDIRELLEYETKDDLVSRVLWTHIENVFRQRPRDYMGYIVQLVGVKSDPTFLDYYEVAATRDLVVHNNRVINRLYLEKAGEKARGQVGEKVVVDRAYYYGSLATMKAVSGAVKRDVESKYGTSRGSKGREK